MRDDRRARLRSLKLRALVRDHVGRELDAAPGVFPPGAALVDGTTAWVLLEDEAARGLGAALAWARRQGAGEVHVLAAEATGILARRAAGFAVPIAVWRVDERALLPAVADAPAVSVPAPPAHVALIPTIAAGGARPLVEHGVVTGEVRGLEVCRVVDDPWSGAVRLEVGVGAHDREAFTLVHGDVPTIDALAGVVQAVAANRGVGDGRHPLEHLAPERLLRWRLEQRPAAIGLVALEPAAPPVPRTNVKDRVSCTAVGRTAEGTAVLVVCSVGVDLDLVPYAVDARLTALAEGGEPGVAGGVWLVTPPRDVVPMTVELAGLAAQPLSLVPFSG